MTVICNSVHIFVEKINNSQEKINWGQIKTFSAEGLQLSWKKMVIFLVSKLEIFWYKFKTFLEKINNFSGLSYNKFLLTKLTMY